MQIYICISNRRAKNTFIQATSVYEKTKKKKKRINLQYFEGMNWKWILAIGLMSRVFAHGPGDRGSISGWVIPKAQEWYFMPPFLALSVRQWSGRPGFNLRLSHTKGSRMVLYAAFLSTQHHKVRTKGKADQCREWSSALSYTSV